MNKNFFIPLSLVLCLCFGACADCPAKTEGKAVCAGWLMPDSAACSVLGDRLTGILFAPQKVKCYHLIGKETIDKDDVEIERNFVRDSLLTTLSKEEIAVLQYALIKPAKSYQTDSILVESPYGPELEFEFTKKKETAHVVVSLSDMTWAVVYDGKHQFRYNYTDKEFIARFCEYYLSGYYNNK